MNTHIYKLNLDDCIVLENARRIKNNIEKIKDLKDLSRKIIANNTIENFVDSKQINTLYVNLYRCQKDGFSSLASKDSLIFDVLCILKVKREELVIKKPQE